MTTLSDIFSGDIDGAEDLLERLRAASGLAFSDEEHARSLAMLNYACISLFLSSQQDLEGVPDEEEARGRTVLWAAALSLAEDYGITKALDAAGEPRSHSGLAMTTTQRVQRALRKLVIYRDRSRQIEQDILDISTALEVDMDSGEYDIADIMAAIKALKGAA